MQQQLHMHLLLSPTQLQPTFETHFFLLVAATRPILPKKKKQLWCLQLLFPLNIPPQRTVGVGMDQPDIPMEIQMAMHRARSFTSRTVARVAAGRIAKHTSACGGKGQFQMFLQPTLPAGTIITWTNGAPVNQDTGHMNPGSEMAHMDMAMTMQGQLATAAKANLLPLTQWHALHAWIAIIVLEDRTGALTSLLEEPVHKATSFYHMDLLHVQLAQQDRMRPITTTVALHRIE
jgi:hypothetical protein